MGAGLAGWLAALAGCWPAGGQVGQLARLAGWLAGCLAG